MSERIHGIVIDPFELDASMRCNPQMANVYDHLAEKIIKLEVEFAIVDERLRIARVQLDDIVTSATAIARLHRNGSY